MIGEVVFFQGYQEHTTSYHHEMKYRRSLSLGYKWIGINAIERNDTGLIVALLLSKRTLRNDHKLDRICNKYIKW